MKGKEVARQVIDEEIPETTADRRSMAGEVQTSGGEKMELPQTFASSQQKDRAMGPALVLGCKQ